MSEAATERGMWRKCLGCGKVLRFDNPHFREPCHKSRNDLEKKANARAVAKWRETDHGADYTKRYAKAQRLAEKLLRQKYRAEYEEFLAQAKKEMGL